MCLQHIHHGVPLLYPSSQCVALASEEIMSDSLRNSRGDSCLVITASIVGRQVSRSGNGQLREIKTDEESRWDSCREEKELG